MRGWWIVVVGCSAPPDTATSTTVVQSPRLPPCGFSAFTTLDAAAGKAAHEHHVTTTRDKVVWPHGQPHVGSCSLHVIDPRTELYVVRDGDVDVAKINREGTLVLVPGISVAGFAVGMSSDVVLGRHPPDRFRITCSRDELGNLCAFVPIGAEVTARFRFAVGGDLRGRLDGIAAYEFFRGKSLRGVQGLSRLD